MESNEAKNLLKLMGSRDVHVLEKVLVTVSNLATFTPNQVCIYFYFIKSKWMLDIYKFRNDLSKPQKYFNVVNTIRYYVYT